MQPPPGSQLHPSALVVVRSRFRPRERGTHLARAYCSARGWQALAALAYVHVRVLAQVQVEQGARNIAYPGPRHLI